MGNSKMGHIMTLANSIIGVGILAMPFCFQKCGIILAILLLVASNFITRLCCYYLLKSSLLCRRRSMEIIAFSVFGSSGKLMVELCIIGYLLGACITYFVVVGDLGPQIIAQIFDLNPTSTLRTIVMIIVTFVCIIPLGLQRNVDSLAAVCTASIGFYFCLVLKIMAESHDRISAGDWMENVDYWKLSGVLQCLPIFSMALSCQMQLFEVFENVSNISMEKMNEYVKSATNICTFVYILVGFFGYVAFCTKPFSGNILLNLSPSFASDAIKTGFVLSVAFSFPLIIFPCRASLYSLLYRRGHTDAAHYIPEHRFKLITISLVCFALFIGMLIPSIELIIGFVGSTIGVAICIMFPASCYVKICQKNNNEKLLAQVLLVFGFILMVLGTYANLNAIDEKSSGSSSDEKQSIFKHYDAPNDQPSFNLTKIIMQQPEIQVEQHAEPSKLSADLKNSPYLFETPPQEMDVKKDDTKYHENPVDELKLVEISKHSISNLKPPESVKEIPLDVYASKPPPQQIVDLKKNGDINNEAIQKEEQEIAIETKEQNVEGSKSEKKRLEETKKLLQEVKEIKSVLEKQNQETQQLVLQKFDEIVDKVEKIEKVQENENKKHEEEKADKVLVNEKQVVDEILNNISADEIPNEIVDIIVKQPVAPKDQTIMSPIINLLINKQVIHPESVNNNNQSDNVDSNSNLNLASNAVVEHIPMQRDLLNVDLNQKTTKKVAKNVVKEFSPLRKKRNVKTTENCPKIIGTDANSPMSSENGNELIINLQIDGKMVGNGRDLKSLNEK